MESLPKEQAKTVDTVFLALEVTVQDECVCIGLAALWDSGASPFLAHIASKGCQHFRAFCYHRPLACMSTCKLTREGSHSGVHHTSTTWSWLASN